MKPRYNTIFLDLDNTLLDFGAAEVHSFYHTCKEYGIPADRAMLEEYQALNHALWQQMEEGTIAKDVLIVQRFETLFAARGISANPAAFNRDYLDNLALGNVLIDGAVEVCQALAEHCTLVITSNGVSRAQHLRLQGTPLLPYLSQVVVSDAAGAEKPSPLFFDYALAQCGNPSRESVLMVGDSLSADIAGGIAAGLHTCWFNPQGLPVPAGILPGEGRPTYQVQSLRQLPALILG